MSFMEMKDFYEKEREKNLHRKRIEAKIKKKKEKDSFRPRKSNFNKKRRFDDDWLYEDE